MPKEKYTPIVHGIIVGALESGCSRLGASGIARITDRTLRNWLDRGREGEEPYYSLLIDVEAAEAGVEEDMVKHLKTAAKQGDWRASQFWLERRRRSEWDSKHEPVVDNKPTIVNVTVSGPSKVAIDSDSEE